MKAVPRCFRWNRSRRPGQAGGMPSGKSSRPVPPGRPRIARRFIAGNQGGLVRSPAGTPEIFRSSRSPKSQGSFVPARLAGRPAPPPGVATLGYYLSPSGLGEGAFHRKQRRTRFLRRRHGLAHHCFCFRYFVILFVVLGVNPGSSNWSPKTENERVRGLAKSRRIEFVENSNRR